MLAPISLNSADLGFQNQKVQPVELRKIPSNASESEREELLKKQKEIQDKLKSANETSGVSNDSKLILENELQKINSELKTLETQSSTSVNTNTSSAPERLRFDTYEPSKPQASAGIYEVKADQNGNKSISFNAPDSDDAVKHSDSAMLYKLSEQNAEKAEPSNIEIKLDSDSNQNDHSMLKIADDSRLEIASDMDKLKADKPSTSAMPVRETVKPESTPDSAMLYKVSEQNAEKAEPSNLKINLGSSQNDHSMLKIADDTRNTDMNINEVSDSSNLSDIDKDYKPTRMDMLNDELAQASEKLELTQKKTNDIKNSSAIETIFS